MNLIKSVTFFYNLDFLFRLAVKVIDETVDFRLQGRGVGKRIGTFFCKNFLNDI